MATATTIDTKASVPFCIGASPAPSVVFWVVVGIVVLGVEVVGVSVVTTGVLVAVCVGEVVVVEYVVVIVSEGRATATSGDRSASVIST